EEADAMIDACAKAGVLLLYAEELFFAPKYVKAKQMADEGAFGRVHLVKQGEKHSGPHSPWFWDVDQSGGGAVMDLGCHGIAFCWWFLGKPKVKSVYSHMATHVHGERTRCSRSTGITASRRRCGTSRAACAETRHRLQTARRGEWCRKYSTPRTRRRDRAAESRCRSGRRE